MKSIVLLSVVLGAGLLAGCTFDTPGYSAKERFQMIAYDESMDQKMCNEDIDRSLMLRPVSLLTQWNIFHRD